MLETIRRKIFETLDRTAFKAQFSGLRAGSFNSGSGLRKIAQSAWTPPSTLTPRARRYCRGNGRFQEPVAGRG